MLSGAKSGPLNGALSVHNGEQHYPECNGTKPPRLIAGLEYSDADFTAFCTSFLKGPDRVKERERARERESTGQGGEGASQQNGRTSVRH